MGRHLHPVFRAQRAHRHAEHRKHWWWWVGLNSPPSPPAHPGRTRVDSVCGHAPAGQSGCALRASSSPSRFGQATTVVHCTALHKCAASYTDASNEAGVHRMNRCSVVKFWDSNVMMDTRFEDRAKPSPGARNRRQARQTDESCGEPSPPPVPLSGIINNKSSRLLLFTHSPVQSTGS